MRGIKAMVTVLAVVCGVLLACGAEAPAGPEVDLTSGTLETTVSEVFVLDDVNLVHTESGEVERDRAILVRNGRIDQISGRGTIPEPPDGTLLDLEGAWVTPGLIDMHVHMSTADAEAYVRSGITTVRNMWGYTTLPNLVADIESGARVGPRIITLSSGLDAPPVYWPETHLVTAPEQADSVVALMQGRGYRELKVYQDLSIPVYDAIVAEAKRRGMTHAGHKPTPVPLEHVIRSGQRSIEHLGGFFGLAENDLHEMIELAKEFGTWHSPTLAVQFVLQGATPRHTQRLNLVRTIHRAGGRLLIGTDSGIDATRPGLSLVEEMELFEDADIPVRTILRMATVDAAEYFGLSDELGRLEPGYRADLAVFGRNPLDDLDALRVPVGVLMGERWFSTR